MSSISLCMIVKNEEQFLENCLNSVKDVVSEMIIVDTGSEDRTIEIAKKYGATIVETEWKNDFASARNLGIEQARGEWILFLDADEEINKDSIPELKMWAEYQDADAYFLRVYNHFGEKGKEASVNPTIRMFRNRKEHYFIGPIHEQIAESIQLANPDARFVMTNVCIDHYGYSPSIRSKKNKTARNIKLLEKELEKNPNNAFHLYNIGIEYLQLLDFEKALEAFRKSRSLVSPKINYTHLLYKCEARCLAALNRVQEAIDCCDSGIHLYPDYTDLHHYKGSFYMVLGDFPAAKKSLNRAIKLSETRKYHTEAGIGTFTTHYLLGLVHESLSEDDRAVENYFKSYQYTPNSYRPLYRIFQLLRVTDRQQDLRLLLKRKFKMESHEERQIILNILLRTHCYRTAMDLIESWLAKYDCKSPELKHWLQIKEECELLNENSNKIQAAQLLHQCNLFHFINENDQEAHLPVNLVPSLDGQSLSSILDSERIARILYSYGYFRAFQQYIQKWKEKHSQMEEDFQAHSVLQIVHTLAYNAEMHFDAVLKNNPSANLIQSAKITLPFDEGFIE
ncbi:glycosyltransferase [Bacillus sp. BRMEA1]|uniref:glycosyltransferase n=1 Tax=Neobacillus endophyticus TaxID=2738405 RepID=UPI0015642B4C|nr:glycosyltransferase family 2 protein [Neobacillus endophyticus]NRD79495.1 glycosyltransferase [Neobacillus endophyticus]